MTLYLPHYYASDEWPQGDGNTECVRYHQTEHNHGHILHPLISSQQKERAEMCCFSVVLASCLRLSHGDELCQAFAKLDGCGPVPYACSMSEQSSQVPVHVLIHGDFGVILSP